MVGNNQANFIWNIADHLRGTYKATDYAKVVLPFTILRRMDCVLADNKQAVLEASAKFENHDSELRSAMIKQANSGIAFYNDSPFDLNNLLDDAANLETNLLAYVNSFSEDVEDIFVRYDFKQTIRKLAENDLLYATVQKYASADFHPRTISNHDMGLIFEELIRKFAEDSAADNGEFFTPRDAIALVVRLIFAPHEQELAKGSPIRSIYDPTAGTGGMLSVASDHLLDVINPSAELNMFGQEMNPESYAICKSDMIMKGQNSGNIKLGNTLTNDRHAGAKYDYVISNPPYGSKWETEKPVVEKEHKEDGFDGRFGPGLPASSDGQLLFLLHAVSKLKQPHSDGSGGGRAGVVLNGSSLFSGDAGSGASNIRKWLFESDLVDTIVALPTNIFYSTGIATYIWIIDNNKPLSRKGKVQLIDATAKFTKLRKSLGGKTRTLNDTNLEEIVNLYTNDFGGVVENSKTFGSDDFGFRVVTVEQPLRKKYLWNAEASATLLAVPAFEKLTVEKQAVLLKLADDALTDTIFKSYTLVDAGIIAAAKDAGLKLTAADRKLLIEAMATEALGAGDISYDSKGNMLSDPSSRDTETVPLSEDLDEYVEREVRPFAPDAWVDESRTKVGFEVPFNRHFYKAEVQRSLSEIQAELKAKVALISRLLGE